MHTGKAGFGMVMAQAMTCGLPVNATTNTCAGDLVTDGVEGFIVPIPNPEAIREKLLYLYENPEVREKISQAALRCVEPIGGVIPMVRTRRRCSRMPWASAKSRLGSSRQK